MRTRPIPGPDADGRFAGLKGFPPHGFVTRPLSEKNVVPVPTKLAQAGDPSRSWSSRSAFAPPEREWAGLGVEFTYRVDGTRYVERIKARIYLCAPAVDFRADIDGTCPGRFRDDFSDEVVEAPQ